MRAIVSQTVILLVLLQSCHNERPKPIENSVKFDSIITHFKEQNYKEDTIKFPLIYIDNDSDFSIQISDNPLPLDIKEVLIKNPTDSQYPVSYSVVYKNQLVSLFEPGSFVCHSIPKLERDTEFEKKLNTMKFQYHWIIDNKLVGLSFNKYYSVNSDTTWEEYKSTMPISSQPILYDDEKYMVFSDCHGEWGGTVYFYNKLTHNIHFTVATCANSVQKVDNKYLVCSSLAHLIGHTDLKEIIDPDRLPIVKAAKINKLFSGEALGYADTSNFSKSIFSYFRITSLGSFLFMKRNIYILNMANETFLAEIETNTIKIINPLFNKRMEEHGTIATNYDGTILVNFKYYLERGTHRESNCLILKDNQFIKIDWNETHAYYW